MQEYEIGKCLKNYKVGMQKYQLFPSLAEVAMECRECSRTRAVSALPHQVLVLVGGAPALRVCFLASAKDGGRG